MNKKKLELVMPAGDAQKMRYAFAYGADAVYAGVPMFSLRARNNGFRMDNIEGLIQETHRLNKKIYLTMNIYAHNNKIDKFIKTFPLLADMNPDGFILSDPGFIHLARELRPEQKIHLSTQANTTNWMTVKFWNSLGISRIVLSRELSLKEISFMAKKNPEIEFEAFVHGAVCIAYSGRCLISNYMNHRDANQGTCVNSCRWDFKLATEKNSFVAQEKEMKQEKQGRIKDDDKFYVTQKEHPGESFPIDEDEHGTYLMNSKDLCAIELLKEMTKVGIHSFKVEGRTKNLYYTAITARAYRRALNDVSANRPFNPENFRDLLSTSSRTLMTGFYTKNPGADGENFDDGESRAYDRHYAGLVSGYDEEKKLVWVESKNPLILGETLEWITPEKNIPFRLENLITPGGKEKEKWHGGQGRIGIPWNKKPEPFTLLRAPIPENTRPYLSPSAVRKTPAS